MKILFFITKLEVGGCQINAINLAKALKNRGHQITFFTQVGPLYNLLQKNNIDLYPINYDVRHPSFSLMKEMAQVVKKNEIDIIQAFDSLPIIEAYGSQIWHDRPVFGMITSQRLPQYFIPKKREIAMVNPDVRMSYIQKLKFPAENLRLVTERLDCDFYRPLEKLEPSFYSQFGLNQKMPIISLVSRIEQGKWATIFLFINTAKYWKKKYGKEFPVQFVITGNGPAFDKLIYTIENYNLSDVVICTGEILDIPLIMNISNIVLGMASTCQQGLATGTPVIVVGDKGYSEIIDKVSFDMVAEHHFNVHEETKEEPDRHLCFLIHKILSDKNYTNHLSQFGRSIALKKFDSNIGAKKLEEIYMELNNKKINKASKLALTLEWCHSVLSYMIYLVRRKITLFFRFIYINLNSSFQYLILLCAV